MLSRLGQVARECSLDNDEMRGSKSRDEKKRKQKLIFSFSVSCLARVVCRGRGYSLTVVLLGLGVAGVIKWIARPIYFVLVN